MNNMDFETFALARGDPREIYGTEVFGKARIVASLEDYYLGAYPVLAQCLVLEEMI